VNTDTSSTLDAPTGSFALQRYPSRPGELLQAWAGADKLLLEYAAQSGLPAEKILVVNDEFGALSVPLHGCSLWLDSQLSIEAISRNRARNNIQQQLTVIAASESPGSDHSLVLLRIPKQLSLLRYQLQVLRELLAAGTPVVCAGMDKHLPRGVADIIENFLGPTERHRGQYKARLFSAKVDKSRKLVEPVYRRFYCEELDCQIDALPNVFSGGQLDIGSRLLLGQFDALPEARNIVDLGCGSGVLGLAALQRQPAARVHFIDESNLAVASAKDNVARVAAAASERCRFIQADGFKNYREEAPDLVLCNPPFHQQYVVDDYNGRRLLQQTHEVLAPGGELWLVANRHLSYGNTLQRDFASLTRLVETEKFIVWRAHKAA
jgi:23S rRNA (guanine1835-N2)-methyltransferase